jgi:hypothetical protein
MKVTVVPMMAPKENRPRITSAGTRMVLMTNWNTSVMLFRRIFSMPVKGAADAFISAPDRMVKEAIWIKVAIAGR